MTKNDKVSQLRTKLKEKEAKASASLLTLHTYKEDIAKQTSFANGRQISSGMLKEFEEKETCQKVL